MSHTILRTLISEMVENYLEEETGLNNAKTGLQTAKHLIKHFGSKPNSAAGKPIQSKKYKTHGEQSSINHEEHQINLTVNHRDLRDHLKKHGWKQNDILGDKDIYHHPEHGAHHIIRINSTNGNTTGVKVYKESGKFRGKLDTSDFS
jgi:hypothetical protein